jgi:hypothetical protein
MGVSLEDENYGTTERTKLFENHLPSLPPSLQPIVLRKRNDAVERLAMLLEMHRHFAVLADGLEKYENEGQYVARCLSNAQQTSIETALTTLLRAVAADWSWTCVDLRLVHIVASPFS